MAIEIDLNNRILKWTKKPLITLGTLLILGGFSLLGDGWWPLIFSIFGLNIGNSPNPIFGVLAIVAGVVCFIIQIAVVSPRDARRRADKRLFEITPFEDLIIGSYLDELERQCAYWSDADSMLYRMYTHYEDKLQDKCAKSLFRDFSRAASALHSFVLYHSSIFPPSQTAGNMRYCFEPDLDIDRARTLPSTAQQKEFEGLVKLLHGHVAGVREKMRVLLAYLRTAEIIAS